MPGHYSRNCRPGFGTIAQMVVIYRVLSVLMTAAPRCLCHLPFCHLLAGRNLLYSGVIILAEKRILSDVSFEACNMGAHCFAGGRAEPACRRRPPGARADRPRCAAPRPVRPPPPPPAAAPRA